MAKPKITVCVECYHMQTIQKQVTTTVNGACASLDFLPLKRQLFCAFPRKVQIRLASIIIISAALMALLLPRIMLAGCLVFRMLL